MNDKKLKQLFAAARQIQGPAPSNGFAEDLARMARPVPFETASKPSLTHAFAGWLPRIAIVCAVFVTLCVVGDQWSESRSTGGMSDGLAALSGQWLFTMTGL